jgi:hypothetical protein
MSMTASSSSSSPSSKSNNSKNGQNPNNNNLKTAPPSIFSDEKFVRKLDNLTPTQESIQTMALWCMHHKNHHESICKIWSRKIKDCMNTNL